MLYAPNDEVDSGLEVDSSAAAIHSLPPSELPERLIIPKLSIDAEVQHVGVTKTGNMAAPNNFTDVSWYKYGTAPGVKGSAVIAGHVDNALGVPAIFFDLKDLEEGDEIIVVKKNGERLHYKVVDEEIYPYNDAPLKRIFNASDDSYLNLITCQGEWVPEAKSAAFRLVVYTKLVE
ncbi:MAG: hypothetical protein A2758_00085 [Candidatus Zambryskibacteria bacterium RIFCSPHIGHO2_01_FULL_49_18]|uniref:Peptidase C60 sortase A and B n=2 Tax=Candidatus Zambryskiibacteriota TaxID=1817925 RepID=A0A1G2T338_9BACT|nr:MAG: hypothetical protein A2758_00085 [Candidatus Zambryskibacteria bacterium RIFCSPHIGHO2_01_FULL_49_18]OHB05718.1 MAG: hypothetical protein A3A26_02440 [Candidatus Zambryskibacteria bacterium RIFCSPLOWO2_01_FULL_47_14]